MHPLKKIHSLLLVIILSYISQISAGAPDTLWTKQYGYGPGEAGDADLGIAAGNRRGHLFIKGRNAAVVAEDEMVDALVEWADYIAEHGVDAALERVDTEKATREAERDRALLLEAQGEDANRTEDVIEHIRSSRKD